MPPRKKNKDFNLSELENMSPLERARILAQKVCAERFGSEKGSTAATEDKNHEWLVVPDLFLQWALGRPGFALGKIFYEIGFEGASKTSFLLWVANLAIRAGGLAAMIETENAGSTEHMRWYLDDPENFLIEKPENLQEGMEMTRVILNQWKEIDPDGALPKVILFDSIGGTAMADELDEDKAIGQRTVGGKGQFMGKAVEAIKPLLRETNTLWAVANQGKDKIHTNVIPGMRFADTDLITASGGHAMPLASHYYVMLKKAGTVRESGDKDGFNVKLVLMKNKLRFPMRELHYEVRWKQSLVWYRHTINFLVGGGVLGMDGAKGNYWCPGVGVEKKDPLKINEMYDLIHKPENIVLFQQELDIKVEPEDKLHWPKQQATVEVEEGELDESNELSDATVG